MASGGVATRLIAALVCAVLAGCGGLPAPPVLPPDPSPLVPASTALDALQPMVVAALTRAGQPLGAVTTAEKGANPTRDEFSSVIQYCNTVIGGNFEAAGRPGSRSPIKARLVQTMSAGEGGAETTGVRAEVEVAYDARSKDTDDRTDGQPLCSGLLHTSIPVMYRGDVLAWPAYASQQLTGVLVAGEEASVVRTTLLLSDYDASLPYIFLHGQVRLTMLHNRWFINIAVLQARPAAQSETAKLTDEAQQIAVTLAERLVAELPP